jgi:hypothetical protein
VSINPDPKDVLTNEQLSEIAQEWMQKMGYGDQPFIVYLHEDIERRHIHIVSLRVDENGKKIDDRFEHVDIDALEERIKTSTEIIKNKGLKERSKKIISAAMRTCKRRKDFEKALEKQCVSVLFRINDEGRIYGATFIDHENKCVFNGSRLGKEFSANVFNDLFKNDKEQDIKPTFEPVENTENMFREKKEDSNIGGIFDLFSPETSGDNHEEEAFIRRMRRKKRKQKRI